MSSAYLHGFLGDPSVWDGIAGPGIRVALPVADSWDATVAALAREVAGCDVAVGYSLGARLALGLLAAGHVQRVIAISGNPGIADAERPARRTSDAAWAARYRSEPLADVLDAWEAQPLFASQRRVDPARLAARRARRLALDPHALARQLAATSLAVMPDYRPLVTAARCTWIVGADDAKFLAIARALPCPTHVVPDCGHDPLLEQPAALAALLATLAAAP